ncbi:type II secretion system F family protein [Vibrio sp. SCSIO 43137]|uniref:type II secretion system F family protein n=1 Tax=Vibrio sp. SCSIO 43137 TaxID=3021011 RepID=UPI0023073110|nr:type II secretion system F family protein [Vibrio sp. SCSIO 43137]WCE32561.1 type II secretion system F family protein [Vibrio sp. SCSIO 43137]
MNIYFTIYVVIIFLTMILSAIILKLFDKVRLDVLTASLIGVEEKQSKIIPSMLKVIGSVKYNKDEIQNRLITAGIYSEHIASGYYFLKIVPFVLFTIIIGYGLYEEWISMLIFTLAFLTGLTIFVIAPDMYISSRGKSNINRMNHRLPFLLDLMNVCINSGMTIDASLSFLAKEISIIDRDLAYVIKKTVDRIEVVGIHKALDQFHEMLPTPEAKSFVMTIQNNAKFGSSIGPILFTLANDIREINMLEVEEKVGKMSAKMSIPMIVFIMIPIVVLIVAPGVMRIFML